MSAFIHPENQKLLWGIISKQEIFNQVYPPGNVMREAWFRNIIEKCYNAERNRVFSSDQLLNFNREVIRSMIQILKNTLTTKMSFVAPSQPTEIKFTKEEPLTNYTRNSAAETMNKQELYNLQFNERQKQYDQMNVRPVPPEVKFEEVVKDEAISNMDELIKQHTEQREKELQNIIRSSANLNVASNKTNAIKIKEDINVTIEAQPIFAEIVEEKSKKSVSWSENLENNETIIRQQKEIDELKQQILSIVDEFRKFKEELNAQI